MSLRDLEIKREYRSSLENIAKDFYIPTLKEAITYDRAVGFFSSSIFVKIAVGIIALVRRGGKIRLIASPNLSEQDIEAIRLGYAERDSVIKNALRRELTIPINKFAEQQLNFMANLIADGYLDIRIAVMESANGVGIYHEKVGIIKDKENNTVVFSGSPNESITALMDNYETMDVYKSWDNFGDLERIHDKQSAFESIWAGTEPKINTMEFKDITNELIRKYKKCKIDYSKYLLNKDVERTTEPRERTFFKIPDTVELHEYQKQAIAAWLNNQSCGIFDMATGTGKTYTALGALSALSEKLEDRLAVIIVAPYQHLVEQWIDDIKFFNVEPIVAYSVTKWKTEFKNSVIGYNMGVVKNFCIVTTNATFITNDFQDILAKFKKNFCFVVDEAHNFGAEKIKSLLPLKARYRIALSATIERHMDEEGTAEIKRYFGRVSIKFGLKEAIRKGFLTPYYYYPVLTFLSLDELDEYERLTRLISRSGGVKDGDLKKNKYLQHLLIERARVVAACYEKTNKLVEILKTMKKEANILVYCGATRYHSELDDEDVRQIDLITNRIASEVGMRVNKFTADEDRETRQIIKRMFATGSQLQVVTAIKCLDEGVNIPAIRKAFILASSTNPKEYIQRRGRVLRKYPGKKYSEIYDFITLPRNLKDVQSLTEKEINSDLSLVRREIDRIKDYTQTALNPLDSDNLIEKIYKAYKLI